LTAAHNGYTLVINETYQISAQPAFKKYVIIVHGVYNSFKIIKQVYHPIKVLTIKYDIINDIEKLTRM